MSKRKIDAPLPCPFCGSDNLRICDYGIECRNCGVWMSDCQIHTIGKTLMKAWNHRVNAYDLGGCSPGHSTPAVRPGDAELWQESIADAYTLGSCNQTPDLTCTAKQAIRLAKQYERKHDRIRKATARLDRQDVGTEEKKQ
jgi:hypothetical protein